MKKKTRWWYGLIIGIAISLVSQALPHDLQNLFNIIAACFVIASIVEGLKVLRKKKEPVNPQK